MLLHITKSEMCELNTLTAFNLIKTLTLLLTLCPSPLKYIFQSVYRQVGTLGCDNIGLEVLCDAVLTGTEK